MVLRPSFALLAAGLVALTAAGRLGAAGDSVAASALDPKTADSLAEAFRHPPSSARPLMIWQWMNGVVTREGITADLEAYQKAGLGGVQNFQIGGSSQALADDPTVQIGNEKWLGLVRFAIEECARLGLSFGTHNCPGWSSSASPAVKVEDSMQKLVWTETKVSGPGKISLELAQAPVDPKWNYYRDVAVLAVPDGPDAAPESVVDLTGRMDGRGSLRWEAPAGKWMILRFGHTTNGATNAAQSPDSGAGLECDKMSRAAVERFWAGYPAMLIAAAGENAGTTFTRIEIDSYEAGPQDWTPTMPEEFRKYRGYDLRPWLPVLAGKTIGDEGRTQRFRRDWNQTIADLFADNYYLFMDELARRTPGLRLLVQPYGTGPGTPFATPAVAGGGSLLSAEFWTRPDWGWNSILPVTSAAHTWGKPLVYGESFTCWPLSAWQDDPHSLKPVGDRAFSKGVNAFMLHAGAQNPWPNARPGMTFGMWGTQFTPGQTWWDNAGAAWLAYLARAQALLQRGRFVGDLCYLSAGAGKPAARPAGFAGDEIGERAFLARVSVRDGKLVLPDGMSYRVLVLPDSTTMTRPIARRIRQLVRDGAVVVGPKPTRAPGLEDYPAADAEIEKIGAEVWGDCDGKTLTERAFGKGRIFCGVPLADVLRKMGVEPDVRFSGAAELPWIHRSVAGVEVYFLSNQAERRARVIASFRVAGRVPELWHADTGGMEPAPFWQANGGRTDARLDLDPVGSVFVVFRDTARDSGPGLKKSPSPAPETLEVRGPWEIRFPAGWGAPERISLDALASWSDHPAAGVKYFSGTATYVMDLEVPESFLGPASAVTLDLGEVKNVAEVSVNGRNCGGVLWKPPFRADLTAALKPGKNHLEIRVTNLWPNRMIGDEQEPDDMEWGEPLRYSYAPGNPIIGSFLARVPAWLAEGTPRPSKGRYTVGSFKFFRKDSPLLPSGLLGPVKLERIPAGPR